MILLCVSSALYLCLDAQSVYKPYSFPTLYPKAYEVSTYENSVPIDEKGTVQSSEYIYALFKERSRFTRQTLHKNGEVYFNFPEVENYLNEILGTLIPDSLNRSNYKVYAARSTNTNAYSFEDGNIYFNIGLLAELDSKDALALVLGHELAHIIFNDQSYSFTLQVNSKSNFDDDNSLDINDGVFHRNEKIELKADSIGHLLAVRNGYNGYAAENIINILKAKYDKSSDAQSHPDWEKRSLQFRKLNITQENLASGPDEAFEKLKRISRYETLELLLERNQYEEALKKAMAYHIEDKQDNNYIYYAYENLRRLLMVYPEMYQESFTLKSVMNDLPQWTIDKPNSTVLSYKEIEQYLEKLSIEKGITEALLTQALFLHQKGEFEKRNQVLVEYLNNGSIRYKKFADYILRPHTYLNDELKDAVLIDDLNFLRRNAFGYRNVSDSYTSESKRYVNAISKMISRKFDNKMLINLSDLSKRNFKDAIALDQSLSDIKYLREILIKSKQSNLSDLFLLNPNHFDTYRNYGIQSFEYISIIAIDRKIYPENKLVMTNPVNWVKRLNYLYFSGNTKYKYSLAYYAFKPYDENKFNFYRTIVKYKLTKSHLLNTVYQAIKQSENA